MKAKMFILLKAIGRRTYFTFDGLWKVLGLASQGVVTVQWVTAHRVDQSVHGWVLCTDHLTAAQVDANVAATVLEHQVARLRVAGALELAGTQNCRGAAGDVDAVLCVNVLHEAGAIPARRAVAAPYVWNTDVLSSGSRNAGEVRRVDRRGALGLLLGAGRLGGARLAVDVLAGHRSEVIRGAAGRRLIRTGG